MIKPYAPGYVKIDGTLYNEDITHTGDVSITWKHRNRLTQYENMPIQNDSTSYAVEATTTYTIEVYDEGDSLVNTYAGLTGESWTYTDAMERADCGIGASPAPLNTSLRFKIWAVRGSYISEKHNIVSTRV
ncbi:MAG: hypothetical protein DRP56_04925 [Planctomycetota bacterium]|nr:MAG: hypothetical protein DRP56_04925 [Planctomycetota bacterium]